ncbi:hypothetical protein B0H15DRAFT_812209 [Mycena belliarum]|uniref:Pre-rRNA-processing protein n=1 Tax=Mycena belliarum TaxID=1033014 RepID=A0AAD6XXS0_9AGAR|nr:hypothetical protein B0H15DRAFT_812209 [Mycena belliae]
MPKSAKKRKDKAADFSKAKLKLGKGKKLANNAIDTSFKARSIALPTQSISLDKDSDVPTTKRRLTFDDLIVHLKHYSTGTRKDAIAGLREILDAHPEILESSLTTLINAAVRVVGDEDAAVRKSLLELFAWVFPRISTEDLVPHATALLLFTTSAQTHIFPEIRVDAIRFLNLFLEHIPAATVAGWDQSGSGNGGRVLEGYLGILSAGTKFGETDGPMKATSTASVVLTPGSKLVVLQSLSTFLRHAVSSSSHNARENSKSPPVSSIDTWYLASWFLTPEAYGVFDRLLRPRHFPPGNSVTQKTWQSEADLECEGDVLSQNYFLASSSGGAWTLQQLSDSVGNTVKEDGHESTFVRHLARTLHSTLISTFLDCAPSVFSPNGKVDETQAKLILAVAEITRHLYGAILQSTSDRDSERRSASCADIKSILGYMSPYFPFQLNGAREIKAEQIFQALNLIYCELTSLLILTAEVAPARRDKRATQAQPGSKNALQVQTERVSDYVVQLLNGESLSNSQLGRPLTQSAYAALLPTIWSLISNVDPNLSDVSTDVLQATIAHASRTSSKSALKQTTVEFMARVVLLDTEPQFRGHPTFGSNIAEKVAEWLCHLPKCLWEIGSTNLAATEIILRFLINLCQRRSPLANAQTLGSLRLQLVPYFSITHPVRGQISGPYSKLPSGSPIRRLALDLASLICDSGLSSAVEVAVLGTVEQPYWCNISTGSLPLSSV